MKVTPKGTGFIAWALTIIQEQLKLLLGFIRTLFERTASSRHRLPVNTVKIEIASSMETFQKVLVSMYQFFKTSHVQVNVYRVNTTGSLQKTKETKAGMCWMHPRVKESSFSVVFTPRSYGNSHWMPSVNLFNALLFRFEKNKQNETTGRSCKISNEHK